MRSHFENVLLGHVNRSYLKNRILVQGQGGPEFQPAGILKYVEDLKRGPNAEIGPIDIFEIASCYSLPNDTCQILTPVITADTKPINITGNT
jgi:hypothetical protein